MGLPTPTASAETTSAPSCPAPCKQQQQQQQQRGVCVCQADCICVCQRERCVGRPPPGLKVRQFATAPFQHVDTLANMREELSDKKTTSTRKVKRCAFVNNYMRSVGI